ncbi:MAG: septum formation protein Maf [Firmicutes bacterium]|nr:septum formation protein Maf [Bacillota bacterium]
MKEKKFVLASASPRRIEIMRSNGYEPIVCPADIEENLPLVDGMKETVMFLALKKAKAVESQLLNEESNQSIKGSIIIAADTVVYKDEIMGKPIDLEDGFNMLSKLRNTWHYVTTGVALVEAGCQNARVFAEVTKVYFKDYSDEELRAYLETDEAYDKAGAYAIQGYFSKHVDKFEGDYDNVVGFPWIRIEEEIKKL